MGWHFLLQGIFPDQGLNPPLLLCRQILYHWATKVALYSVYHSFIRECFAKFSPRLWLVVSFYWHCLEELQFYFQWLPFYQFVLSWIVLLLSNLMNICLAQVYKGFPGGSVVKKPPAMQEMQETWVRFVGWDDPMEKEMATHSSILAGRTPWAEEPGGLQFSWLQSQIRLSVHVQDYKDFFLCSLLQVLQF